MPLNQETNSSKTVWNSYALARWNFKEVLGKSEVWVDDFEYNWLASQGGGGGYMQVLTMKQRRIFQESWLTIVSLEGYCWSQQFNVGETGLIFLIGIPSPVCTALKKIIPSIQSKEWALILAAAHRNRCISRWVLTRCGWRQELVEWKCVQTTPLEGKVDEAISPVQYGPRHKHCGLLRTFLASCNTTNCRCVF